MLTLIDSDKHDITMPAAMDPAKPAESSGGCQLSCQHVAQLEAKYNSLQNTVEELKLRMEALESGRAPAADTATVNSSMGGVAESSEVLPTDVSVAEASIDASPHHANPSAIDIDDLLREAEAVGQGIYDEDMGELMHMYVDVDPPVAEAGMDVAAELGELLREPAFQAALMGGPSDLAPAADFSVSSDQQPCPAAPDSTSAVTPPERGLWNGKLNLILGDSLAVPLDLPAGPGDWVLNLAVGGNTWRKEKRLIGDHLKEWKNGADKNHLNLGKIFIWLGGNEVYGKNNEEAVGLCEEDVMYVLDKLHGNDVFVAGPAPRLRHDANRQYEDTPAFRADQTLRRMATTYGMQFTPYLGRALTCMMRRRHVVREDIAVHWFNRDGIHLSDLGYQKIMKRLNTMFL